MADIEKLVREACRKRSQTVQLTEVAAEILAKFGGISGLVSAVKLHADQCPPGSVQRTNMYNKLFDVLLKVSQPDQDNPAAELSDDELGRVVAEMLSGTQAGHAGPAVGGDADSDAPGAT